MAGDSLSDFTSVEIHATALDVPGTTEGTREATLFKVFLCFFWFHYLLPPFMFAISFSFTAYLPSKFFHLLVCRDVKRYPVFTSRWDRFTERIQLPTCLR